MLHLIALIAAVIGGVYAIGYGGRRGQTLGACGIGCALLSVFVPVPIPFVNLILSFVGAGLGMAALNIAKVDRAAKLSELE